MTTDMDIEGTVALLPDEDDGGDDAELRAVTSMLGARRVAKAVDRLGVRLGQGEERAQERARVDGDRLDKIAGAVESLAVTVSGLVGRLDHWEEEGSALSTAHAKERLERHGEVLRRLDGVEAAYSNLPDAVAGIVAPVFAVLEAQGEDDKRFRGFVGARLVEVEAGADEREAVLRSAVLGAVSEYREHTDGQHQAQAAALEALGVHAREQFAGARIERAEDRGLLEGLRDEVAEGRRVVESLSALTVEEFSQAASSAAMVRGVLDAVRGEVADVRSAVDSAAAGVTGEVQAVRDVVLADAAGREERQGEALRDGLAGVRREVDQAASIAAGVAAAVDRTAADVGEVRQAVTAGADATCALVQGAAEECAAGLLRLGEAQAARDAGHHLEVTGALADVSERVRVEAAAGRTDAKVRGEGLRDQLATLHGDTGALVELMSEVPAQVERSSGAAVVAVEKSGALLAERVTAAGEGMTARTDHLCSLLKESGFAADSAVVSLGRRLARVEEKAGITPEAAEV